MTSGCDDCGDGKNGEAVSNAAQDVSAAIAKFTDAVADIETILSEIDQRVPNSIRDNISLITNAVLEELAKRGYSSTV